MKLVDVWIARVLLFLHVFTDDDEPHSVLFSWVLIMSRTACSYLVGTSGRWRNSMRCIICYNYSILLFVSTSKLTGHLQEVAEVQGTVQSVQSVTIQRALGNKLYHHLPPTALLLGEWVRKSETNMAELKKLLLKWTRKLQSIKANCCYPAASRW